MGASTIAILLLGIVPLDKPITDQVDVIELNHFYDEQGRHVFSQNVFWDWNPHDNRFDIRDWRLVKHPHQHPINNTVIWHDGNTLRKVTAVHSFESWTQLDVELAARSVLPKDQRRELSRPITRQTLKGLTNEPD